MRGQSYQWGQTVAFHPVEAANDFPGKGQEGGWVVPYLVLARNNVNDDYTQTIGSVLAIAGIGTMIIHPRNLA